MNEYKITVELLNGRGVSRVGDLGRSRERELALGLFVVCGSRCRCVHARRAASHVEVRLCVALHFVFE